MPIRPLPGPCPTYPLLNEGWVLWGHTDGERICLCPGEGLMNRGTFKGKFSIHLNEWGAEFSTRMQRQKNDPSNETPGHSGNIISANVFTSICMHAITRQPWGKLNWGVFSSCTFPRILGIKNRWLSFSCLPVLLKVLYLFFKAINGTAPSYIYQTVWCSIMSKLIHFLVLFVLKTRHNHPQQLKTGPGSRFHQFLKYFF